MNMQIAKVCQFIVTILFFDDFVPLVSALAMTSHILITVIHLYETHLKQENKNIFQFDNLTQTLMNILRIHLDSIIRLYKVKYNIIQNSFSNRKW